MTLDQSKLRGPAVDSRWLLCGHFGVEDAVLLRVHRSFLDLSILVA